MLNKQRTIFKKGDIFVDNDRIGMLVSKRKKFSSIIFSPYLHKIKSMEQLVSWLYLKCVFKRNCIFCRRTVENSKSKGLFLCQYGNNDCIVRSAWLK
jgi:hypothetical protein